MQSHWFIIATEQSTIQHTVKDFEYEELRWTRELCEKDSDGDGFTNGEELGDPCCIWHEVWVHHPLECLYMSQESENIYNYDASWPLLFWLKMGHINRAKLQPMGRGSYWLHSMFQPIKGIQKNVSCIGRESLLPRICTKQTTTFHGNVLHKTKKCRRCHANMSCIDLIIRNVGRTQTI